MDKKQKISKALKASWAARKREAKPIPINGAKTDMGFLNDLFKREGLWSYARAKKMLELLQSGKTVAQTANYFNVGKASVKNMIQEFKRAHKQGFTLEEYYRKDRPCRYGKKVLAS